MGLTLELTQLTCGESQGQPPQFLIYRTLSQLCPKYLLTITQCIYLELKVLILLQNTDTSFRSLPLIYTCVRVSSMCFIKRRFKKLKEQECPSPQLETL